MRAGCEVLLSYRCHEIYLNIDFHEIDKDGKSHGGYDWRFVMAERCIGCDEDNAT
jgi:hypothetical protein